MTWRRTISRLLLIIGLGFAFLGQFYFAYRREYVWDGVLFWCIALLSFGILMWRMARQERGRFGWRLPLWMSERPMRPLAVIGGGGLAFLAGWLARRRLEAAGFDGILWMWLLGVCWFLLAFAPPPRSPAPLPLSSVVHRLRRWLGDNRVGLIALASLLLAALVVRAADLEHIPANLGGDEGTQGVAALKLLGPPLGNPFSTGWFSVPTMSFLAYGISMRIFGASVAGLRMFSALIGALTVLTTFLLARELWGRRVAWLAATVLTFSHFHIHFSRLGSNQIADGFFITLALWLLVRGLRSERAIHFALAGAAMGLGWYGYFGARLIGVIVALYLVWRVAVEYRFLARYGMLLLVLLGAAVVVVAPLLFYYADHPVDLVSRSRQVSIFASGWLAREQEITGRSAASLLLQQFWKSVSAFNYTLDPTFWYRPTIPLLDFVSGVLFVLGLLWTTARCRWSANGLLLLWFWSALILGWVMTENPPSSQRMVVVAPALALLVGLGLHWLMSVVQRVSRCTLHVPTLHVPRFTCYVSLIVIAVLNLYYYFAVYTPTRVYGNPTAEVATVLARYLTQQEDDYVVYFYGPPFMYWNFGTLDFMVRGVEGVDVLPGTDELPQPDLNRGARFVFLPERLEELETVRAQYPGGVETPVYSNADSRLLYVLYEVGR